MIKRIISVILIILSLVLTPYYTTNANPLAVLVFEGGCTNTGIWATIAGIIDGILFGVDVVDTVYSLYELKNFIDERFSSSVQKGNFGEELAAQTHTDKTRLKSHYGGGHGPDNVYIKGDHVFIEEVKTDGSRYTSKQMSPEQIEKWLMEMENHSDPEIRETAYLIRKAMSKGKLWKIYTSVDTINNTIVQYILDDNGEITRHPSAMRIFNITAEMIERAAKKVGVAIKLAKGVIKILG